eukprot:687894-Prymnesium_polylepis.1
MPNKTSLRDSPLLRVGTPGRREKIACGLVAITAPAEHAAGFRATLEALRFKAFKKSYMESSHVVWLPSTRLLESCTPQPQDT